MINRLLAGLCAALVLCAPAVAADVKISAMPAASALSGADVVPGVQGTTNVKITASQIKTFAQSGLAASATTDTTNASNITSGTLAGARGGAGSANGILQANGSGTVSAITIGSGLSLSGGALSSAAPAQTPPFFRGVNLVANNRFVGATTWPSTDGMDYFLRKKLNLFRLVTMWNNLQVASGGYPGAYNATNLAGLQATIAYLTGHGAWAIIDSHDSLRYKTTGTDADAGTIIYSDATLRADFIAYWAKLANDYKSNPHVIFEITNEPHDVDQTQLFSVYQDVITAIRATGAQNMIVIDGNDYSSAQNWISDGNDTSFRALTDPVGNLVAGPHLYIDRAGGTTATCYLGDASYGASIVTQAARAGHYRLFLGEWGGGDNSTCYSALHEEQDFIESDRDVWIGNTMWAAYGGQPAYNVPETFPYLLDPDIYNLSLAVESPKFANVLNEYLTDTYPAVTSTAIAASAVNNGGGGTLTTTTAPDGSTPAAQMIEDSSTGGHEIYVSAQTVTAGTKYTFQFDIQRVAGNRDIYVKIFDTTTFGNYSIVGVHLDNGAMTWATNGASTAAMTAATASVRYLGAAGSNGVYRVTVSVIIESTGSFTAIAPAIDLTANGAMGTSGYAGNGSSGVKVWNVTWKAQ